MNTTDHDKCQRAIEEIRNSIPKRLKVLDDQFNMERDSQGKCDYFRDYTKAMTDLVFDVIEHAVSYADKAEELEAFSDRLQQADHALNVAIGVLKRSENNHLDWHREFERELHLHDDDHLLDSLRIP